MKFEFKSSFDRSIKSFPGDQKEEFKKNAIQAIEILSRGRIIYQGIGLKRLKGNFWEVRKGLKARVLFRWKGGFVEFILAIFYFSIT